MCCLSVPGDELRLYKLTENAKKIPAARRDRMADAAYHIRGISYPYKKTIFAMFYRNLLQSFEKRCIFVSNLRAHLARCAL